MVSLKLELLQHAGSFKPRGAFTTVLAAPEPPQRLVAASGGNHGLAVAHVGATLGLPTEIYVPAAAPQVKVDGIRARGATVVLGGDVRRRPGREPRARAGPAPWPSTRTTLPAR